MRFLLLLVATVAWAQPAFEVASIRPAAPNPKLAAAPPEMKARIEEAMRAAQSSMPLPDRSRLTLKDRSLLDLIAIAYRVSRDQVSGPGWMTELHFDIQAKLPDDAPAGSAYEMLQSLLGERFKLRFHRENRDLAGFALVVAKDGPKLTPAGIDTPSPAAVAMDKADSEKMQMQALKNAKASMDTMSKMDGAGTSTTRWNRRSVSLSDFADQLSRFMHRPVVDLTSVEGKYDLMLEIVQNVGDSPEYAASQAVTKLGLKLEQRKVPTAMLIVDSVEKTPTEN